MSPAAATPAVVVAVDVGGTTIKGAVLERGQVLLRREAATRVSAGPAASLAEVDDLVGALLAGVPSTHHAEGIGIAVPGTVDEDAGLIVWAENLDWRDVPLRDRLGRRFGLPVGFGHDVRAAGLAEWRLGAGQGGGDLAYLSVGTGIAVALVADGRVLTGHGWAGEVGHGGVRRGSAPCACGGVGCAETFASAAGMARRYQDLTGQEVDGSAEVLGRALAGDERAREVWHDAADRLGEIVAEVIRVLGVRRVVVGGGASRAGEELLRPLRQATRAYLTYHPIPEIVCTQLGEDAGIYGAALLARQAAAPDGPARGSADSYRPAATSSTSKPSSLAR